MIEIAGIQTHRDREEAPRSPESRARRLEFDTTLYFLDKHFPPRATILQLGAGPGTHALHFARKGNRVLATDGDDADVQALVAKVEDEGLGTLQVRHADPTRLEALSDWDFQAVLCLGPYYQLRSRDLRRRCLLECRRVVHDRGIVAVSYLNRSYAVASLLQAGVRLNKSHYDSLLQNDDSRIDYPDPSLNAFHFSTPEAVEAEVRSCGFEIVDHAGTDGPCDYFAREFEALGDEAYQEFFAYHTKTCTQPSQRGASHHGLVVLRKV
jgi:2-polyprenyl-3-methyl-5-hydroxy-6-metoxy-1,4-benzoquinol methylase